MYSSGCNFKFCVDLKHLFPFVWFQEGQPDDRYVIDVKMGILGHTFQDVFSLPFIPLLIIFTFTCIKPIC